MLSNRMRIILLLAGLFLSACNAEDQQDSLFEVLNIESDIQDQTSKQIVTVFADLSLKLTPAVEEALRKGVIITLKANAQIVHDNALGRVVEDHGRRWQIQYLPLSRHYSLTDLRSKEQSNWPRLRHALAALKRIEIELPPVKLDPGDYRLEVMVYLDRRKLPAPLRLPALVSSDWKLESNWYKWQFHINQ